MHLLCLTQQGCCVRDHKPTLNKPVSTITENVESSAESSDNKKDDDVKAENSEENAQKDNEKGIYNIKNLYLKSMSHY